MPTVHEGRDDDCCDELLQRRTTLRISFTLINTLIDDIKTVVDNTELRLRTRARVPQRDRATHD